MGWFNTAKTQVGASLDTAGTWAKAKGAQMGASASSYGGMAKENAPSMWKEANMASNGFLNPTAMGMGVGGAVGGTVGATSDNGSFLGGIAGGAMLGGLGAAAYTAGRGYYKVGSMTNRAPAYQHGPNVPYGSDQGPNLYLSRNR